MSAAGWAIWVVANTIRRTRAARVQAEVRGKLLEKFGSSRELLDYLQTEAGQKFVDSGTVERTATPYGRILGSVQAGIILAVLGIGFLVLQRQLPFEADELRVLGTLALALGIGFLLSSLSAYMLSKSWGLFERPTVTPPARD
jgi:hypothetical protein